jgi:prepilin-type N-terminal cleavage/methylation domain-containing protein
MNTMKKRGFTLIELLIALGIMGVIAAAISTFFFSNYRIMNETSVEIDLQKEGEKAINLITEKAMASKGIVLIKRNNVDLLSSENSGTGDSITEIGFASIEGTGSDKQHVFELYDNKLLYGDIENSKVLDKDGVLSENEVKPKEVFQYVKEIFVKADEKYKDTKSIIITIRLEKKEGNITREKEVSSEAYFRNK